MACISPLSIPRPNGRGNRDRISVPCGKCVSCYSKRRSEWSFRLLQELKNAETAYFVTLTYDPENIPVVEGNQSLSKIDVQLFLKRLRQSVVKVDKSIRIRYFLSGEYGNETGRPHYHMVIFNLPYIKTVAETKMLMQEFIQRDWKLGLCHVGSVTEASIMYTTKYMLKGSFVPEGVEEPFSLMSRGGRNGHGLGYEYIKRMADWHRNPDGEDRNYSMKSGKKVGLPRFYRDKIFTKQEIENINIKTREAIDQKENEKLYECFKNGENPFLNEVVLKNDLIRRSKINKIGKI